MRLQLDENTLNAYITEAIKQETNESWDKIANFATKKAASKAAKAAAKTAKKTAPKMTKAGEAFGNLGKSKGALNFADNSKRVGDARRALKAVNSDNGALFKTGTSKKIGGQQLEYVAKTVKDPTTGKKTVQFFDKTGNTPLAGEDLKLARSNYRMRFGQYSNLRTRGNLNRWGTAATAAAAGLGAAALSGGGSNNDPDAPWNDAPGVSNDDDGSNPGGGNGGYPWDDTTPEWTPRTPRHTKPQPTQPVQQSEPETQQRQPMPKIEPVSQPANMPTGVTLPQNQQPGLIKRETQPSLAQSAVQVMGQTANQSNLGLNDRIATNRRTSKNTTNAIDQARRDGSMTRQQARDDKKLVRGVDRALRTGKPMNQ